MRGRKPKLQLKLGMQKAYKYSTCNTNSLCNVPIISYFMVGRFVTHTLMLLNKRRIAACLAELDIDNASHMLFQSGQ